MYCRTSNATHKIITKTEYQSNHTILPNFNNRLAMTAFRLVRWITHKISHRRYRVCSHSKMTLTFSERQMPDVVKRPKFSLERLLIWSNRFKAIKFFLLKLILKKICEVWHFYTEVTRRSQRMRLESVSHMSNALN